MPSTASTRRPTTETEVDAAPAVARTAVFRDIAGNRWDLLSPATSS